MSESPVLVVIPALNEAATIGEVVKGASVHAKVVVIDDGSSDETRDIASKFGASVYSNAKSQGYDAAIRRGMQVAHNKGYSFVITMDADGQHDYNDVGRAAALLASGADIVTTDRAERPRISEKIFCAVSRTLWGIPDPLSGLKGYNLTANSVRSILAEENIAGARLAIKAKHALGAKHQCFTIKIYKRQDQPRYGGALRANIKLLYAMLRILLSVK